MALDKAQFFENIRPIFGKLSAEVVKAFEEAFPRWHANKAPVSYLAYGIATVFHETARTMMPITEYGPRSYFDKYEPGTKIGKNLGNTQKGDGWRYRGRGYVQITGRANYKKLGDKLGVDLVGDPELALNPEIASQIMRIGVSEGLFTGKKFSDYLDSRPPDYRNARRVINGLDKADLIADYARAFERALKKAGYDQ